MPLALVEKASDGRFYITPLRVGLNGVSWATYREAMYIADAVNMAYEAGKEEIRSDIRRVLGVPQVQEGDAA